MLEKLTLLMVCVMLATTFSCSKINNEFSQKQDAFAESENDVTEGETDGGTLTVRYLDVGQGDAIVIEMPDGEYVLIDAGSRSAKRDMEKYLRDLDIKKFSLVIFTHPHEDHIGNADDIVNTYKIDTVLMPNVEHTTKTYEALIDALILSDAEVKTPVVGDEYVFGEAIMTIIAPQSGEYDDLNDYSIVTRLVYGDVSFLFTGDAAKVSEEEMILGENILSCNVLKVAHHGSSGSTKIDFLKRTRPDYAVISYGIGNSYGHPHYDTLTRLAKFGVKTFDTSKGTVTIKTDGTKITVE